MARWRSHSRSPGVEIADVVSGMEDSEESEAITFDMLTRSQVRNKQRRHTKRCLLRALAFVQHKDADKGGHPIEAADLEEFRQSMYDKDGNLGIDSTVPIQTLSSQLGQNIYNLAYPFINEWQGEWTPVPMQTWSSQLGQIYTNLATPFINEWQAGEVAKEAAAVIANVQEDAHEFVEPWSAIEVDWDSFVFEVPAKTALPLQRPRACSHDIQDRVLQYIDTHDASLLSGGEEEKHDTRSLASEFSETSVAPDSRFRYTSEADEAEFEASSSCTSESSEGEGNKRKDTESQVVKEGEGESRNHQNVTYGDLDKVVEDEGSTGNTALQGEVLPAGHVKRLCKYFAAHNDKPG